MKPTDEQIKEFWEWCGFTQLEWARSGWHYEQTIKVMNWIHPLYEYGSLEYLPRISLDNLFKYAVPRVKDLHYIGLVTVRGVDGLDLQWDCLLFTYEHCYSKRALDPALALFWAIYEVLNAK